MNLKIGDRVEVQDNSGKWWTGTLINFNEFRENPYCVELDDCPDELAFVDEAHIRPLADRHTLVSYNLDNNIEKVIYQCNGQTVISEGPKGTHNYCALCGKKISFNDL